MSLIGDQPQRNSGSVKPRARANKTTKLTTEDPSAELKHALKTQSNNEELKSSTKGHPKAQKKEKLAEKQQHLKGTIRVAEVDPIAFKPLPQPNCSKQTEVPASDSKQSEPPASQNEQPEVPAGGSTSQQSEDHIMNVELKFTKAAFSVKLKAVLNATLLSSFKNNSLELSKIIKLPIVEDSLKSNLHRGTLSVAAIESSELNDYLMEKVAPRPELNDAFIGKIQGGKFPLLVFMHSTLGGVVCRLLHGHVNTSVLGMAVLLCFPQVRYSYL
jgi:hypothetical protein